jgi:hypothetical protein
LSWAPPTWPSWNATPTRALLRLGPARLTALIAKASHGHQDAGQARQWLDAAQASLELYDGHPAVDFPCLAAEVVTEIRLLRATQAELSAHAAERERRYRKVDPAGVARSLPGLAESLLPSWASVHSRHSSPGRTEATAGISGCHRL